MLFFIKHLAENTALNQAVYYAFNLAVTHTELLKKLRSINYANFL